MHKEGHGAGRVQGSPGSRTACAKALRLMGAGHLQE